MEKSAADRLCVVTGTTSGIGKSLAERLLESRWQVLGLARRAGAIDHPNYRHVSLDLADLGALEAYFQSAFAAEFPAAAYTRVGLVNNAALLEPVSPLAKLDAQALGRAFLVNAAAPVWLMGFFLRHCGETPLRMVNVSSGAAERATPSWGAYCSSKAALLMAGKVFGVERADGEGTSAGSSRSGHAALLSYDPGVVDTAMQGQIRSTTAEDFPLVERFMGFHERGELADPAGPAGEIARFLEGDGAAPFSEGQFAR